MTRDAVRRDVRAAHRLHGQARRRAAATARAYNVSDGIVRRRTRPPADPATADPVPIEISLWPTSMVFRQGHRIRLEVASSNFPRFDRNPNTGAPIATATVTAVARQAVHHGPRAPSRIVLPVVPESRDWNAIGRKRSRVSSRRVTREFMNTRIRSRTAGWRSCVKDASERRSGNAMITEPSTLATDYVLGTLCAVARVAIARRGAGDEPARDAVLGLAFAATAVRQLRRRHVPWASTPCCRGRGRPRSGRLTTIVVGLAACLLLSADADRGRAPRRSRRWLLVRRLGAVRGLRRVWMLRHDAFVNVIVEYGAAMLLVARCCSSPRRGSAASRRRDGWSPAWRVTFAAARVQQSGFDLHRHLNHNDLQHLVQMVAVWLLYKAAELRQPRPTASGYDRAGRHWIRPTRCPRSILARSLKSN